MSPPPISLISHLTSYHLSIYLPLSPIVLPMGSWYGQSTNGLPLKESLSKTGLSKTGISVALSYPYWNFWLQRLWGSYTVSCSYCEVRGVETSLSQHSFLTLQLLHSLSPFLCRLLVLQGEELDYGGGGVFMARLFSAFWTVLSLSINLYPLQYKASLIKVESSRILWT